MNKILVLLFVLWGFAGCCSSKNVPIIWYWNNEIVESLGVVDDYCIYDFSLPFKGVMDRYESVPAQYQILLPHKKALKRILYGPSEDRCFLYTRNRGIAIMQDLHLWERKSNNGLMQIPKEIVEDQLSGFDEVSDKRIRINEKKQHYIYVDNEIRIVVFNLSEDDLQVFVNFPLENLRIKRRGEVRLQDKYRSIPDK